MDRPWMTASEARLRSSVRPSANYVAWYDGRSQRTRGPSPSPSHPHEDRDKPHVTNADAGQGPFVALEETSKLYQTTPPLITSVSAYVRKRSQSSLCALTGAGASVCSRESFMTSSSPVRRTIHISLCLWGMAIFFWALPVTLHHLRAFGAKFSFFAISHHITILIFQADFSVGYW